MDEAGSRADRHARALLEALFAPSWHVPAASAAASPATNGPPRRGSVASVKSNKSLSTQPFKPSKPSSLAASASGQSSDEEHDPEPATPERAQRTPKGKPSQWEEADEDPIQHVLHCLQKVDLDEEDKIDDVRDRIEAAATRIAHQHGAGPLTASQLDAVVLDLMHRHREDLHPTGQAFAAPASLHTLLSGSPAAVAHRPPALRSTSSTNLNLTLNSLNRPWTPSRLTSTSPGPSRPGTPTRTNTLGMAADTDPIIRPSSRSSGIVRDHAPSNISVSLPSPAGSNAGVIGSGSPRASPKPWIRPLPGSTRAFLRGSPSSSVGLHPESSSRPTSPLLFNKTASPRLNVGAIEFQPKTSPSVNSSPLARHRGTGTTPVAVPAPPWQSVGIPQGSLSAHSTSSAGSSGGGLHPGSFTSTFSATLSKDGADDDEDEEDDLDEFSPFATVAPSAQRRLGESGLSSGNSATSDGDVEYALDPSSDATMTPFDVLSSILGSADEESVWTPERVEESLAQNGWDVEATMVAIMANEGNPLPSRSSSHVDLHVGPVFTPKSEAVPTNSALNPKLFFPSGPKGFSRGGSSGVNVMSGDVFAASKKPGAAAQRTAPHSPTLAPSPAAGPSSAGTLGASRVCRYYLAGECRRADCRFSHDLGRALCRFWLKGQCLNDPCSFLHDMDVLNNLASGLGSAASASSASDVASTPDTPPATDDFPSLTLPGSNFAGRKGTWSAPKASTSNARWAAALQKKQAQGALAAVQSGERQLVAGSQRNAPTAPRASISQQQPTIASRSASRIALHAPALLPTLSVGRSVATAYANHRESTSVLSEQRNRALAKASEAWKRGDGAAARTWSLEGTTLNARLAEESKVAAEATLRERHRELRERLLNSGSDGGGWGAGANASDEPGSRGMRGKLVGAGLGVCLGVARKDAVPGGIKLSADERVECLLDLHGLHSAEAVDLVEAFLLGLERESIKGLAYLAVGQGQHSSNSTDRRHVRLSGAVKQFLASWGYPYASVDGVLVVDPCTHLQ